MNLSSTTPFQKRLYRKVTQCVLLPSWLTFWCAQLRPVSWHPTHVCWRGLKGAWWIGTILCFCGWIINKSNINKPGIKKKPFPLSILASLLGFWEHLGSSRQSFCKGSPQKVPAPYPGDWCLSRSWKTQNTKEPWTQNLYKASNSPTAHQKLLEHQDLNILKPDWNSYSQKQTIELPGRAAQRWKQIIGPSHISSAHPHAWQGHGTLQRCFGKHLRNLSAHQEQPPFMYHDSLERIESIESPDSTLTSTHMYACTSPFLVWTAELGLAPPDIVQLWDITSLVGRKAALVHPSPVEFTGDTAERDRDDRSCWKTLKNHISGQKPWLWLYYYCIHSITWYNMYVGI